MISSNKYSLCILFIILLISSCKTEKAPEPKNIVLHNKSLNEIRRNLNGKWKIQKMQGGFVFQLVYPKNMYVEFILSSNTIEDSIRHYNDTTVFTNTKCNWNKEYANNWVGDTTYVLSYKDIYLNTVSKIIYEVKNDTLYIMDNYPDGFIWYCTKK